MTFKTLGKTNIKAPALIFGTSCLGNLYQALEYDTKREIISEIFRQADKPVVLDTAGKYGAGLALEVIGKALRDLSVRPEDILISNKLGWFRTPLKTTEPTFEKGVWMDLDHDAVQKISKQGIIDCWEQGCVLLGGVYHPQIVSVHDPDEYLAQAGSKSERKGRFNEILDAYAALLDLKQKGYTQAVGIGAKDWKVIREITNQIELDWVMLAISFTVYTHPPEILEFMDQLKSKSISIINSAVFHAGFLTGGSYFDYRQLRPERDEDRPYFSWREKFFSICNKYQIKPAAACVQFGMSHPGIVSVALNTSKASRIKENIEMIETDIPNDFWIAMINFGLISREYPPYDR